MTRLIRHFCLLLFFLITGNLVAQNFIQEVKISSEETALSLTEGAPDSYLLVITGPENYEWKQEVKKVDALTISPVMANGQQFPDGKYTLQVSPIFQLTDAERQTLRQLSDQQDANALAAFRAEHQLPSRVDIFNVHFAIENGHFVTPTMEKEQNFNQPLQWNANAYHPHDSYPSQFASLTQKHAYYGKAVNVSPSQLATDNTPLSEDAQVFTQDVIVQGSLCVGIDCNSAESFGFDTQRLKENNLRINFDDTSNSASFPANDWRLVVNDTNNGGASYFAIEDATAGRQLFKVSAGAPSNSLTVDGNGDVGIGRADAVLELHINDGDSPAIRLEQDGSGGFASQVWDIAGNETNFFVRDVSHSSAIPFKIKPGADVNSLVIDSDNNIGIGILDATQKVHIASGNVYVASGRIGVNIAPTVPLDVMGNMRVTGNSFITGDHTQTMSTGATFFNTSFATVLRLDAVNARVGIGTATPGHQLELSTDDAYKPSGGSWLGASDRRLKKDIKDFKDGLDVLMNIRPVSYHYNGKLGLPTEDQHIGVIAQEIQTVAPYTIKPLNLQSEEAQGADYLGYDGTALTYVLINAVQEQQQQIDAQQKEINQLKAELSEVEVLKSQMAALSKMVAELNEATDQEQATAEKTMSSDDE